MKTIKLTDEQAEMAVFELNNGIRGDDPKDKYDNQLKRIIKKIEEA